MIARPPVDSVPALYGAIHAALEGFLYEHFGVVVRSEPLSGLRSYLVTSPRPGAPKVLVLGDQVGEAERAYLLTHTAAHLLLGHACRPFATILEPRRTAGGRAIRQEAWQEEQERHADLLTAALLWGSEREASDALGRHAGLPRDGAIRELAGAIARALSRLLFGHRHRAWQSALFSATGRRAVLGALRLGRALYHRSGARRALARESVVCDLREVYCLTELVAMSPDGFPGRRATGRATAGDSASAWRDISEVPPWHGSAGEDRSLRN
jgi:hypothetical protein